MFEGTPMASDQSMSWKESLLNRKEWVINILNESYKDDSEHDKSSQKNLIGDDDILQF